MTKKIILLLGIITLSFATQPFPMPDLKEIREQHGQITANRIEDYFKFINLARHIKDEQQKIKKVNFYLNQMLEGYDAVKFMSEDYWATREEFLITGVGDCEDFAISKFFTLVDLGVDRKKLFMGIADDLHKNQYHMVLLYYKTPDSEPLVLDNVSFLVLPIGERKDLKLKSIFNLDNYFKIDEKNQIIPHNKRYRFKNFEEVLTRMEKNLIFPKSYR